MDKNTQSIVIFAGGGTGGHIYPGVALAQKLEEVSPNYKSIFIGSGNSLEKSILEKTNYELKTTQVKAFNQLGVLLKVKSLFWHLPIAIIQAVFLLKKLKPKWILSLGSYAAVPVGLAAFLLRVPLFVWEPNAKAGLANRLLSYFSRINFIIFKEVSSQLKGECVKVGLPLRRKLQIKQEPVVKVGFGEEFSFSKSNPFKILLVGGSLGSDFINVNFCKLWSSLYDYPLSIIHQTGSRYFTQTQEAYQVHSGTNLEYKVVEYLHNIHNEYSWANLVIARAGVGTLFELAACQKASLLIPYSFSADNHQVKNAKNLASNNQALMIEEKEFSELKVQELIKDLVLKPSGLETLEKNISTFYIKNTEQLILDTVFEKIKN